MQHFNIEVPEGIKFISDWKEYTIPKGRCIIDKGVTGCGYTEFCLRNDDPVVLCSPRRLLLENKRDQHTQDPNILYLENNVQEFQDIQGVNQRIYDHLCKCQSLGLPAKFMITYDSSHYIIDFLESIGKQNEFIFVIDEFQSIFLDAFFKSSVEFDFIEWLQGCSNVIFLSATPMLDKYLEQIDDFKDLDFVHITWPESVVETVHIQTKQTNQLSKEAGKIIEDYKAGKYPMKPVNGKIVQSTEAVLFFNSVREIITLINKHELTPDDVNIICANTVENQRKLDAMSRKRGYSVSAGTGFLVGRVPLLGEPNKKFTLCTKCTYIGADFHSLCASTFIFSDPNLKNLALDISLDLPQIVGRQRDPGNPFKNDVVIFYKTTRGENLNDRSLFDHVQELRQASTDNLLNLYGKANTGEKADYVKKLRDGITVSQYSGDFVSISSKTGVPVKNDFIVLANERAWEVSQRDYQDKVTVTRAIDSLGGVKSSEYKDNNDLIVKDFLDNHFYMTGIFDEKMKLYCEFMDVYKDNDYIREQVYHKIEDPKFRYFYEYFGTSGCSAHRYREKEMTEIFRNRTKDSQVCAAILNSFKSGDRFSKKDIKTRLQEIYDALGVNQKAKATDLGKYFKLVGTRVSNNSKIEQGFRLDPLF